MEPAWSVALVAPEFKLTPLSYFDLSLEYLEHLPGCSWLPHVACAFLSSRQLPRSLSEMSPATACP